MTDKAKHQWAATGVSSYPLSHPIVGQGQFFNQFKHFIHLVADEAEQFAHVFAVIAQWGVGKSRLGYELVAQTNGSSRGWWVREDDGSLAQKKLFDDDQDREQYLGLYIRYGQVANDYNNVDNWFAYGLYKALLPLARGNFDGSIQGQIAKEAGDRLVVDGFEPKKLAALLEVSANHSDEKLYEDTELATRLCNCAYDYLKTFGIKYVLVVLDELETAAEAATYGLDSTDIKRLDGRAIKLMGKAIKEEDPRRKLPWLRYVALCSPQIGSELREIQSTARRFELTELQPNAFADVSDFVQALDSEGRLAETYPPGLVEAAYAMSAGNFGWFNVIMASVDERLRDKRTRGEKDAPTVGAIFDELVNVSPRIRDHVLDHTAIDMVKMPDRRHLAVARDLLYGQLPVVLGDIALATRSAILAARNEFDEPIATLFRRVEWDELEAIAGLQSAKFVRVGAVWRRSGIDQTLDLRQLLSNLATYAIHETKGKRRTDGKRTLVIPLRQSEFVQLVALLYPHMASEDAARGLWRRLIGSDDLDQVMATHIGPSVEMIAHLDVRHRKQEQTSLIFRDPDQNSAHEKALASLRTQSERDRAKQVIVGAMRVIDSHWSYDAATSGIRDDKLSVIATSPRSRGAAGGGLVSFDGLKLHPKGRALFAMVKNQEELERLCLAASLQFGEEGRTPVVAFTTSRALVEIMANPPSNTLKGAENHLLLYQLSPTEERVLHQIGIASAACSGFRLDAHGFTAAFTGRLQSLVRPFATEVGRFRSQLNKLGRIAWPLRSSGRIKDAEQELLIAAWRVLGIETAQPASLASLDEKSGIDIEALKVLLGKLGVTPKARAAGYLEGESAGLFSPLDDAAEPQFPPFLIELIHRLLGGHNWTFADAESQWFWGYTWESVKEKDTYFEWMAVACAIGFAKEVPGAKTPGQYTVRGRPELRNATAEADNWLRNDYPKRVGDLEAVFGAERVKSLFAPEVGGQPGTKTLNARGRLNSCATDLNFLDREEVKTAGVDTLRICAQGRGRLLENLAWVYQREAYEAYTHDPNVKTLDFESDDFPLWQRIRRASLFAAFVRKAETQIRDAARALDAAMRQDAIALDRFPIALFSLSLDKITHILDGALAPAAGPGATSLSQANEPGTLRQNLRELRVAAATVQLEGLAREVGLDLANWLVQPLSRCEGHITTAFRDLRERYDQLLDDLVDTRDRLAVLADALDSAPNDFEYPSIVPQLALLDKRPDHVEATLFEVQTETAEVLRSTYDGPARLGNFQPLMTQARELFQEPRGALTVLVGHIRTVENAVRGYRLDLIARPDLRTAHRGVEAIAVALSEPPPAALTLAEVEAQVSLANAVRLVGGRLALWTADGESRLSGTAVSFLRWSDIVAEFDGGTGPELEEREADALVKRRLIQRAYRLGGPT